MPAGLDPLERELAEIDAEFEQTPPEIRKKFGVIPIIVLFFVLVTFSGLLWYSYSVGVRAGSEDAAPLLKLSGPIKVQPPNPGGITVAHQEKTVFNRNGDSATKKEAERILPPPEKPRKLSVTATPLPRKVDKPKTNVRPKQQLVRPPVRPKDKKSPTKITPIVRNAPVRKKSSTRKKAAGDNLERSFRIQTGALTTRGKAERAWRLLVIKHKEVLGGLKLHVDRAVVRGVVYFRVQAGPFPDRATSTGVCKALKKRCQGCIVVSPR